MNLTSSINRRASARRASTLALFAALLFFLPANLPALPASPEPVALQANLGINGFFAAEKAQPGRTLQAAVVVEIPEGYHVNGSRPLSKYAVPTVLQVEAPGGIRISPVVYPRAVVRQFSFSKDQLAVYEGRAVMRFNVTLPADYSASSAELRVRLRYQSCNNEACFPPKTREITMPIQVASANESVKRTNGALFGGGAGRARRR
ncbi:MAG: protein-disulfide reductase DsbD N-terminal domain-containing protein [Pyrinomonadaceae bacterium]